MNLLKPIVLSSLCLPLIACSGIKTKEEIAKMEPKEVAELACNAMVNKEIAQFEHLVSEKSYKKLVRVFEEKPEKLQDFVGEDCEPNNVESLKRRGTEYTRVSFTKAPNIRVFKVDGYYQVGMEG